MSDLGRFTALTRKQILYLAAALALFVAYYGVPVAFLKAPVRDHLKGKYAVHFEIGSVRISVRGIVVTAVSAVWPSQNATMSVQEMMLGFSPLKSLARRRIVLERLKFIHPSITVRLPALGAPEALTRPASGTPALGAPEALTRPAAGTPALGAPEALTRPASGTPALGAPEALTRPASGTPALGAPEALTRPASGTPALGAPEALTRPASGTPALGAPEALTRLPRSFDLAIRRGQIHLMRGPQSVMIHRFDAEIARDAPGQLEGWIKVASRELGNLDVSYEEGRSFSLNADPIQLAALTDIAGSPQKLMGQAYVHVARTADLPGSVTGDIRLEGLVWTGPKPHSQDTKDSPESTASSGTSEDTSGSAPRPPESAAPQVPMSPTSAGSAPPAPQVPMSPTPTGLMEEQVQFIFPPLNAEFRWNGRWDHPVLSLNEAQLTVGGVGVQAGGRIDFSGIPEANLDFYAPAFDEPGLEEISRHFYVLRFLHKFLETIESPSHLQAKMHLAGPLSRPENWRYAGLVDIRRDTFSYEPFLGQYSFLGTVEFDEHGVRIPEILMPFGDANLTLSGTAADYATRSANLALKGKSLAIGPIIQYYVPDAFKPEDTSAEFLSAGSAPRPPESAASQVPMSPTSAGEAFVDLALTRFGSIWNLDGSIDLKRVAIQSRVTQGPVQAYGKMTFSSDRADGLIRVRTGSFETAIHPYAKSLFTEDVEYGFYVKQTGIRWAKLADAMRRDIPVPFLPLAGTGDVSIRMRASGKNAAEESPQERGRRQWIADGTAEILNSKFVLPPFATPVDSVSAYLSFETRTVRVIQGRGVLAGSTVAASGWRIPKTEESPAGSAPPAPQVPMSPTSAGSASPTPQVPMSPTSAGSASPTPAGWAFQFQSPALDLARLIQDIRPDRRRSDTHPFEFDAAVTADKLMFHGFEIPGVSGTFKVMPGVVRVRVDTPIPSRYDATGLSRFSQPRTEMIFEVKDPYPLKHLFKPGAGLGGEISGTVALRGSNFSSSKDISGKMLLNFNRLAFKNAAPLLSLLELTNFSLIDGIEFEPFLFESKVEKGAVRIALDRPSNVGLWKIRGLLGLDASYLPLDESDSAFHVTFYPRENILTRILHETKILDLLGGKREGIKLDFHLVGNYNESNILWTEEPFVSVIRGRVSELVPDFFASPSQPDTARTRQQQTGKDGSVEPPPTSP